MCVCCVRVKRTGSRIRYQLATRGAVGRTLFLGQVGSRRLRAGRLSPRTYLALFRYLRIERQPRLQASQGETLTFLTVARKRCDYSITPGVGDVETSTPRPCADFTFNYVIGSVRFYLRVSQLSMLRARPRHLHAPARLLQRAASRNILPVTSSLRRAYAKPLANAL